jgi:predicted PurR-regulated permease PerM
VNAKRGTLLVLAALVAAFAALLVRPYLQFALLAVLLAYVLYPLQRRLEPRVGERPAAGLLVVVAIVAVLGPLAYLVAVVVRQAGTVIEAVRASRNALDSVEAAAATYLGVNVELDPAALVGQEGGDGSLVDAVLGVFGGLTELSVGVVVTLFLLYYLVKDGDRLVAWTCAVVPLPEAVQDDLLDDLDDLAWAVLVGNVAVAVVQGVLTGVALLLVGFSSVVFWTVVVTLFALLPLVGAPLVWGPAAALLALQGQPAAAVFLAAWGGVVVAVADDYLRPIIGGHEAQLNPGLFVVGIFGGIAVLGVMGVFFGPIVLGVAKTLLEAAGREVGEGEASGSGAGGSGGSGGGAGTESDEPPPPPV